MLEQKPVDNNNMDYIREFDIRLEKEMYYAGEMLTGNVILDTVENFKLKGNLLYWGNRVELVQVKVIEKIQ